MTGNYVATGRDGGYLTVAAAGDAVDLTVTEPGTHARATVTVPAWKLADDWVKLDRNGGAA